MRLRRLKTRVSETLQVALGLLQKALKLGHLQCTQLSFVSPGTEECVDFQGPSCSKPTVSRSCT